MLVLSDSRPAPDNLIVHSFAWLQHDAHVKLWRWRNYCFQHAYSLHVLDYYLWKETHRDL